MNPSSASTSGSDASPSLGRCLLLGAAAGGMGWGIRGQYGHETGAMIAGVLLCSVLALLFAARFGSAQVVRAVAWGTVAIGFGGSMTYGQTVGLTHNANMVGNTQSLLWGLLGLAIKGGLWIGFCGAFLGMGLSGIRYQTREILTIYATMLCACALGIAAFNEPYNPAQRLLPKIYFSADWRWTPDVTAEVLKPRRETWGGFLAAMAVLLVWLAWIRRDGLASRLGLWGLLGGAVGFPLGQCLQAFHAWNRDLFQQGWLADADRVINWWNFMETTFGATMGATLALGLWLSRHRINAGGNLSEPAQSLPTLSPLVEWALIAVHGVLLVGVEFADIPAFNRVYDFGLMLGLIPIVGITAGRFWPWLTITLITAIPIAGKTYRNIVVEDHLVGATVGGVLFLGLPLGLAVAACIQLRKLGKSGNTRRWLAGAVAFNTLLYFLLNNAFFRFPWPWQTWTARTPNALIYAVCTALLLMAAWRSGTRDTGYAHAPQST